MKRSKRSDEFVNNVRLYLLTAGKNEEDIDEVTGELKDHLAELERRGKSVESIIAGSPAEYMESLEGEMKNDYASWIKYIPIFGLYIIAYSALGPALKGTFELDIVQLIGLSVALVLSLVVIRTLFRNMAKKEWTGKKNFFAMFFASLVIMLLFIAVYLGSSSSTDTLYTASTVMNKVIVGMCIAIFIIEALMLKAWVLVIIPVLFFGPEFALNYTSLNEKWRLIGGSISSMVLILASILVYSWFIKKREAN